MVCFCTPVGPDAPWSELTLVWPSSSVWTPTDHSASLSDALFFLNGTWAFSFSWHCIWRHPALFSFCIYFSCVCYSTCVYAALKRWSFTASRSEVQQKEVAEEEKMTRLESGKHLKSFKRQKKRCTPTGGSWTKRRSLLEVCSRQWSFWRGSGHCCVLLTFCEVSTASISVSVKNSNSINPLLLLSPSIISECNLFHPWVCRLEVKKYNKSLFFGQSYILWMSL